jgi:hypothetical protein
MTIDGGQLSTAAPRPSAERPAAGFGRTGELGGPDGHRGREQPQSGSRATHHEGHHEVWLYLAGLHRGPQLPACALKGIDFGLDSGQTLAKIVGNGRLVSRQRISECDANLLAVPPRHINAQRLLFLRNVEIESIRRRHSTRKIQLRSFRRNVADDAIEGAASIFEMYQAAQKTFLPDSASGTVGMEISLFCVHAGYRS